MIKSFRANAGALKNASIIAVQGRHGAKLKAETLKELKELSVELVIDTQTNPASWFNYANKIVAVQVAQNLANTDCIAWLDSDIVVNKAPLELLLDEDVDFAARGEFLPPAVRGNDKTHIPYWQAICELLEVDFASLPDLLIDHRNESIKMYFNSGVFAWRKSSPFAALYADAFAKVLNSKIAQHDGNFFTADQIILGPVIIKGNLNWRHLSYRCHHMTFQGQIDGPIASPDMGDSALIHYSKSLNPGYRNRFMQRIAKETPTLHGLISAELPRFDANEYSLSAFYAKLLRIIRSLQWQLYAKRINKAPKG